MHSLRARLADLPHRQAFALAWPMILANISAPLVGMVDTAMLGHFSTARHIGAVALGSILLAAVYWTFSFIRLGTTAQVGQALGAGNRPLAVQHLGRSGALALILGAAVLAVQWFVFPLVIGVLSPAGELHDLALGYTQIRVWALPAILLTTVVTGWFIGAQNTRVPLLIMVAVNVVNLGLDVLFVGVWGRQSAGAAEASLIAELSGAVIAVALLLRQVAVREMLREWSGRVLLTGWRVMLAMNSNLFVRTLTLYLVITFFTAQGARFGPEVLAANAILLQLMHLTSFGLDGYAHASEAMSARAIGERSITAFHRANAASAVAALGIAVGLTALYAAGREPLLAIMTDLPGVTATTRDYYAWIVVLPLASIGAYLLDGIFIGSAQTRTMRNLMVASALLVFVPAWLLGQQWAPEDPNANLWRAFILFNIARGLTLGWAYWRRSKRASWLAEPEVSAK